AVATRRHHAGERRARSRARIGPLHHAPAPPLISRRTQAGIDTSLVSARAASHSRLASLAVLCRALTAPERLTQNDASTITTDLDRPPSDEAIVGALGALAALLYARPDLVRRAHVASLARLMLGPISPGIAPSAASAWQCLAVSPLARQ